MTTTYESEFHVFVSTQTNDLSQTTTTAYPPADVVKRALGLPSQITDANNQAMSYSYDAFGRLLTINRPSPTPAWCATITTTCKRPSADLDSGKRYLQVRDRRTKADYADFWDWLTKTHYADTPL